MGPGWVGSWEGERGGRVEVANEEDSLRGRVWGEWRVQGVEECGEWQESWEDFWVGPKGGRDVTFTFTKSKVLLPCQKRDLMLVQSSDPASSVTR